LLRAWGVSVTLALVAAASQPATKYKTESGNNHTVTEGKTKKPNSRINGIFEKL
jgi:hypothetical protein